MATVTPGGYSPKTFGAYGSANTMMLELVANDCQAEMESECEECPVRKECCAFWDLHVTSVCKSDGTAFVRLLRQFLVIRAEARIINRNSVWKRAMFGVKIR